MSDFDRRNRSVRQRHRDHVHRWSAAGYRRPRCSPSASVHPAAALPPPAPSLGGRRHVHAARDRTGRPSGRRPRGSPYHLLALTTAGHGTVEVDFDAGRLPARAPCSGSGPGQALRFGAAAGPGRGHHHLGARPARRRQVAGVRIDDPAGPARWQLAGEDEDAVISEFAQLAVDCDRHADRARSPPRCCGTSWPCCCCGSRCWTPATGPARAARRAGPSPGSGAPLEDGHPHSRRVEDYAARLGCSVRTLTRASLAVTGRTAKQVVDDRVALEARRLLACTPMSVAEVGRRLGFPRADQLRPVLPPRGRA